MQLLLYVVLLTFSQSLFDSNEAQFGGALIAEKNSNVNLHSVTFTNNFAWRGGVLYSTSSTITTSGCIFINNTANYGGALYFFNNDVTLYKSRFHKNAANQDGGALYCKSCTVTMSDTEFTENSATIGAIVYVRADSKVIHQGSINISNNLADGYAAIYLSGSEFHDQVSGNTLVSNNSGSLVASIVPLLSLDMLCLQTIIRQGTLLITSKKEVQLRCYFRAIF